MFYYKYSMDIYHEGWDSSLFLYYDRTVKNIRAEIMTVWEECDTYYGN